MTTNSLVLKAGALAKGLDSPHASAILAVALFYISVRDSIPQGLLEEEDLTKEGLISLFSVMINGTSEVPNILSKLGLSPVGLD